MADNLTRAQRSYCMGRVRNRDTSLETSVRSELHRRGLRFRKHVAALPGRPDLVFPRARLAVFIDGDFWHGYRFPVWRENVSAFWQKKIEVNRIRDRRNFRKLRRMGWTVLRIWQHQSHADLASVIERICALVAARTYPRCPPQPQRSTNGSSDTAAVARRKSA
jgi:DNA mismatch endonuclease, patch repair protein